jgi:hypothetical protein
MMTKKRLDVTWKKEVVGDDFRPALKRFRGYLQDNWRCLDCDIVAIKGFWLKQLNWYWQ